MNNLTLGSLFDGSGCFCLAAKNVNITPVWLSEIEPFCLRVTEKRLPDVRQYGDIRNLNGAELPPVNIITGSSPCQDVSISGKRTGLSGTRSGLFFEMIRIIREMRKATCYPRYVVWENVPGVFSSQKGDDFRCVIQEFVKIKTDVPIPKPEKWEHTGLILGDDFSLAWRVLDSQFFVGLSCRFGQIAFACGKGLHRRPATQRRKRVFIVIEVY